MVNLFSSEVFCLECTFGVPFKVEVFCLECVLGVSFDGQLVRKQQKHFILKDVEPWATNMYNYLY